MAVDPKNGRHVAAVELMAADEQPEEKDEQPDRERVRMRERDQWLRR